MFVNKWGLRVVGYANKRDRATSSTSSTSTSARVTDLSLRFADLADPPSRWHPLSRPDRRLPAGAVHGGLLRFQCLCAVVHGGAAQGACTTSASRVTVVCPGPVPSEFRARAGFAARI